MFISGFVAERVSLRYFLASGMIVSGVFSYLFGMAKEWDIHSIGYFIFVQAGAGIAQTTGWPGVVTLIGRWFGKSKRGLIFGIWNSHTSIGNILGTVIAAEYVETNWAYSFIVPGFLIAFCGFILFLFVIDSPEMVGCQTMDRGRSSIIGGEYHETHSRLEDDGNDIERDDANLVKNFTIIPHTTHLFLCFYSLFISIKTVTANGENPDIGGQWLPFSHPTSH